MNQTPEMDEKKTSSPETAPIAATAEHNANFEENIRAIIRSGKPASVIRDDLDNYHANDIAEVLETLDTATRKRLYNILSLEMTARFSPISMNRRLIWMNWGLTGRQPFWQRWMPMRRSISSKI